MEISRHYFEERTNRENLINSLPKGTFERRFVYNHPEQGNQFHDVYSNGVIEVRSFDDKLITKLIARPAQLVRLYKDVGERVPYDLFMTALRNKENGYNEI